MSPLLRRILLAAGILLLLAGLATFEVFYAPNSFSSERFVIVSKGESFQQVLDSLENAGVIRSRFLINAAGRLSGYTTKMQVGKYRFTSGMSNLDILKDIRFGSTVQLIAVTLPEGLRPRGQAHRFARQLGIDSARFMTLVEDPALARQLGVQAPSLIGYLMPSTYKFYWQTDEAEIVTELVREFWRVFDSSLQAMARERLLSVHEVLTMASIVEMETAIDSERSVIAGVYYNRLKKRMRLQADPTVQYVLPDGPRPLLLADLEIDSPYNTYRHAGLPPGPITNPGRESILAALNPARHRYLYFVATGYGGHRFTRTFNEHRRAIKSYHHVRKAMEAEKKTG